MRKLPADFAPAIQFYPEKMKQKSRRIPGAEGGSVLTLGWAASQSVEKQPRIEAARGQGDLILRNLFAKKQPCKQSDSEKDNRLPTQPAQRKSAPPCNPDCERN